MKTVLIHGQKPGSTCQLARILAGYLGGESKEFFLPRDFGEFCVGCTQCFAKSETLCPHYEKLLPITRAMDEADVIILASPVYVYHVTGAMKAFLDHYGYRWMVHRPEESMFHKQIVCISTAAGAGMKSTCKDMADSAFFWGAARIYRFGAAVRGTRWDKVDGKVKARADKALSRMAGKIKARQGRAAPGLRTRGFFSLMRMLMKKGWNEADRIYWEEKGWTRSARPWR